MSEPLFFDAPTLPGRVTMRSPSDRAYTAVPVPGPPGPPGPPGEASGFGPVAAQELIDNSVGAHVVAEEPHPAYDDMPNLVLLFENRLV